MPAPRRRKTSATGAPFFPSFPSLALLAVVALLLLPGCASLPRRSAKTKPAAEPTLLAPRHVEVGRVLSLDSGAATLVIELAPRYQPPSFLAGVSLLARDPDTLEPRAQLEAAPYRSGRMLGAYLVSGSPLVGDEVVIAPDPEPEAKTSAAP